MALPVKLRFVLYRPTHSRKEPLWTYGDQLVRRIAFHGCRVTVWEALRDLILDYCVRGLDQKIVDMAEHLLGPGRKAAILLAGARSLFFERMALGFWNLVAFLGLLHFNGSKLATESG